MASGHPVTVLQMMSEVCVYGSDDIERGGRL